MCSPKSYSYRDVGEKVSEYVYDPASLTITSIQISSNTAVYTKSEYESRPELKDADGIFIWDGTLTLKWKKYGSTGRDYASKAVADGLVYQMAVDNGGKSEKIWVNLRPGSWRERKIDGRTDYYIGEKKYDYNINLYSDSEQSSITPVLNPEGAFRGTMPGLHTVKE